MSDFDLGGLFTFWGRRSDDIAELVLQHVAVVVLSIAIAAVIGIAIGIAVWNRPVSRSVTIAAAGVALTIPSLALLALLTPVLGLGWTPTVFSLVFYSLLPIVRNTVVGLREVPPAIMESAKGMGMSPARILLSVQLPIAWPIILTGVRVAAQLTVGIAAIAAYVAGPGLASSSSWACRRSVRATPSTSRSPERSASSSWRCSWMPPSSSSPASPPQGGSVSDTTTTSRPAAASDSSGVGIRLDSVTKVYPGQPTPAVDAFSMTVEPGELIMFVGPSGCGKTTTMKMINRIIEPTSGTISIDGRDVLSLDPNECVGTSATSSSRSASSRT